MLRRAQSSAREKLPAERNSANKIPDNDANSCVSILFDKQLSDNTPHRHPVPRFSAGARSLSSRPEIMRARAADKQVMHTTLSGQSLDRGNPESSVDQKLVTRVQKGDKKAFDLLVIKYQGKVGSIVSRYVNDYHEIADVTQETFIKAYRAIGRFRGDSAFYTWLYRIAINCAKNYLVAKGRRPPAGDIDIDEAEHLPDGRSLKDIASPERVLNRQQLEQVVKNAISSLPEDLRAALTLREFDGLSYDEIAAIMDCPVGTVRSRIFRAREAVDGKIQTLMEGN